MDERNPLPGRITHRLNLDSQQQQQRQEQQRLQRQAYERQRQQKRKRKQQKRRAKQEEERAAKQAAEKKAQQKKKEIQIYNDPAKLFKQDSDSGISFSRLRRKINQMYPKFAKKNQKESQSESEEDSQSSEVDQSEQQSEQQSSQSEQQSEQSRKKKQKKQRKSQKKPRNDSQSQQGHQRRKMKSAVKIEPQMSAKDKLVQQVAVRWNYALPEWPPADYNYEAELNKRGYRSVEFAKFKFVDEVVDGLIKVYELDGYKGVYRGKIGLIDVRPKDQCPSLNYFYSKSEQELHHILKKALEKQLELLDGIQYKQRAEEKLLEDLKRKLKQLTH